MKLDSTNDYCPTKLDALGQGSSEGLTLFMPAIADFITDNRVARGEPQERVKAITVAHELMVHVILGLVGDDGHFDETGFIDSKVLKTPLPQSWNPTMGKKIIVGLGFK